MEYRIIYEKSNDNFYIQKLESHKNFIGKIKQKWVFIKKWYGGSVYPPFSDDTYEKEFFKTFESAEKKLKEIIKKDKLNDQEIIREYDLNKECLHSFISVFYGSEWDIECSKCEKSVWDIYNKENALYVINEMLDR